MEDLKVTIIQSDIHWEEIESNLAQFEEKIWKIDQQTDLIILPEMFSTGFSMNPQNLSEVHNSRTFRWMQQQAAQKNAVIAGSYIINEKGSYYNRFYAVYPDGNFITYNKKHLFGLAGETRYYQQGNKREIFEIKGWKIFPQICYDLRFPVWARSRKSNLSSYEYDLLIYVASWPKPRIDAWDILLKARAIENISYCAGVNRVGNDKNAEYIGHSGVYDFMGKEIVRLDNVEGMETVVLKKKELEEFRNRFPFQKDADDFTLS